MRSTEPQILPEPQTACSKKLDEAIAWHGVVAVAPVPELRVGIRVDSAEAEDLVRRYFAGIVADDVEALPNYSARLGTASRDLAIAYRSCTRLVGTKDRARVLRTIRVQLDGLLATRQFTRLDAMALIEGDHAVVAPAGLRQMLPHVEKSLRAKGLVVVDSPTVQVTPDGRVAVLQPRIPADESVLEGLDDRSDPVVTLGAYPVDRVLLPVNGGSPTRGTVVAAFARSVLNYKDVDAEVVLGALDELVDAWVPFWPSSPSDWVEALTLR